MKTIVMTAAFTLLLLNFASAQKEVFSARLKNEEAPQAVTKAIEKDFPGMIASDFQSIPMEFVDGTFVLSSGFYKQDKPGETYYVNLSGKGFQAEATYDGTGHLLSAREYLKNVPLPIPIERAIQRDYPDWTVAKDHELISINQHDMKKVYYHVMLNRGNEKIKATYDANGYRDWSGREHRMQENG
ncbi:MAG: hypothetical protein R2824_12450 [Saprospiraceae bacterium]|nr:hypothetical protein [Lewinella sp.]